MDLSEQMWQHTFEIKLPTDVIPMHVPNKTKDDAWGELVMSTLKHIKLMRTNATETLQNTIVEIKQLLPHFDVNNNERMTRSILPLGNIFKGLFGVASEDDINVLRNHMKEMATKTNKLQNAFMANTHLMNSYMTAVNKRLDNAMVGLSQTFNLTNQVAHSFDRKIYELENVWPYTARIIAQEAYSALSIHSCAEQLLIGVQKLMEHKIPIELIPLHTLKHALEEVSNSLKDQYPLYYIPAISSEYYYSHMPVSYGRLHDSIYITINIPITVNPSFYNVYQILTFPVPVNQSSSHTTQIQNVSPYIAIQQNENSYLELKEFQFSQCLDNKIIHCPFLLPRIQATTYICSSALFFKNKEQIKSLCDFSFIRHNIQSVIFEVEPGKLLITGINDIYMSCRDKITKSTGCKFCLIA